MATRKPTTRKQRPAPPRRPSMLALSAGAALLAGGAALIGIFARRREGLLDGFLGESEGHPAPDLTGDTRPAPSDRAPVDFRPDPTAPVPVSEREALRPA